MRASRTVVTQYFEQRQRHTTPGPANPIDNRLSERDSQAGVGPARHGKPILPDQPSPCLHPPKGRVVHCKHHEVASLQGAMGGLGASRYSPPCVDASVTPHSMGLV